MRGQDGNTGTKVFQSILSFFFILSIHFCSVLGNNNICLAVCTSLLSRQHVFYEKDFYSVNCTGSSEKKSEFSQQESNLLVTSPDALPLRYRRLVGAKAIKLGSCDKRPAYWLDWNVDRWLIRNDIQMWWWIFIQLMTQSEFSSTGVEPMTFWLLVPTLYHWASYRRLVGVLRLHDKFLCA